MDYQEFLRRKQFSDPLTGHEPDNIDSVLFDFQRDIVRWAIRRGRAAIFADCGLGKTLMQLEWAKHVNRYTCGDVLILAPLAVSAQTAREARNMLGMDITICASQDDIKSGINITNYEKLHNFEPDHFSGVVLDECFAAGTEIDTINKGVIVKKRIETLSKSDIILNAYGEDTISDIHRREVQYAIKISLAGSVLIVSPNHPFFTQRGWVGAQDLLPGDYALETGAALRLVWENFLPSELPTRGKDILRDILLSEMADEHRCAQKESAYSGGCSEEGKDKKRMANEQRPEGHSANREDKKSEPDEKPGNTQEGFIDLEIDEPQTFRAWGEWPWANGTAGTYDGCSWSRMGSGICFVVGKTESRLSNSLQNRLGERREKNCYRTGWQLPPLKKRSGQEEGFEVGFIRVDGVEVLEQGHHELDKLRDADGKLYFYDIGATRHPSFSVNGVLVHNSSIIKHHTSKTRDQLLAAFSQTPYRLACTATPSPNDYMELGNHAEFLGVMTRSEMLSMFFIHDGGDTSKWRLKGHAESEFWKWLCTWAVMVRRPSDLGYDNDGFTLPPINYHSHVIPADRPTNGMLFAMPALDLVARRNARRETVEARCRLAADLVNASPEPWVVWCDLNVESEMLRRMIPDAIEVKGSDDAKHKEDAMLGFADGKYRVMDSKASIAGFGMNWQHCNNMAFVGLSDSFEAYYQATRRCWRFGQKSPVNVHVITSELEGAVVRNIQRKEADAQRMAEQMVEHMSAISSAEIKGVSRDRTEYKAVDKMIIPPFIMEAACQQ